jgi:hypothetical protein
MDKKVLALVLVLALPSCLAAQSMESLLSQANMAFSNGNHIQSLAILKEIPNSEIKSKPHLLPMYLLAKAKCYEKLYEEKRYGTGIGDWKKNIKDYNETISVLDSTVRYYDLYARCVPGNPDILRTVDAYRLKRRNELDGLSELKKYKKAEMFKERYLKPNNCLDLSVDKAGSWVQNHPPGQADASQLPGYNNELYDRFNRNYYVYTGHDNVRIDFNADVSNCIKGDIAVLSYDRNDSGYRETVYPDYTVRTYAFETSGNWFRFEAENNTGKIVSENRIAERHLGEDCYVLVGYKAHELYPVERKLVLVWRCTLKYPLALTRSVIIWSTRIAIWSLFLWVGDIDNPVFDSESQLIDADKWWRRKYRIKPRKGTLVYRFSFQKAPE